MYAIIDKVHLSQQINNKTVVTTIYAKIKRYGKDYYICGRGEARCHPQDTFVYTAGVSLSTVRAEKDLYNKILSREELDRLSGI